MKQVKKTPKTFAELEREAQQADKHKKDEHRRLSRMFQRELDKLQKKG